MHTSVSVARISKLKESNQAIKQAKASGTSRQRQAEQEEDEAAFLACMKRETVLRCETCVWVCRVGFEAVMWGQKQEKSKRASPNGSVGGKKKVHQWHGMTRPISPPASSQQSARGLASRKLKAAAGLKQSGSKQQQASRAIST